MFDFSQLLIIEGAQEGVAVSDLKMCSVKINIQQNNGFIIDKGSKLEK
jgi:hypothetical protein